MKRSLKNLFMIIMILASLIGTSIQTSPVEALGPMGNVSVTLPTPPTWTRAQLMDIWGISTSDIYAVGYGMGDGANKPLIYDKTSGATLLSPALPTDPAMASGTLEGVWAFDNSHVYAVGNGTSSGGATLPLVYTKGSGGWSSYSPILTGWTAPTLVDVWGTSASNIFAVGDGTRSGGIEALILRSDGSTTWTPQTLGVLPTDVSHGHLSGVWGSSDGTYIYAVGFGSKGGYSTPLVYRSANSGTSWTAYAPALPSTLWSSGQLYAVWGSGTNDIYAVGSGSRGGDTIPLVYHSTNGTTWEPSNAALPSGWNSGELFGIWGSDSTHVYLAGSGVSGTVPLLYRKRTNGSWAASTSIPGWSSAHFESIWGVDPNNVYAAGFGNATTGGSVLPMLAYAGLDTTVPGNVTGLNATPGALSGTVSLSWTAPADDAGVGKEYTGSVESYVVRYSTASISTCAAGTGYTGALPEPATPGTPQTMTVSGLTGGTHYYFAVCAVDEMGLQSSTAATDDAVATIPGMGGGMYDDRHDGWIFTGNWIEASTTGPYQSTFTYSATAGNSATFTIEGNQFTLYYLQHTNRGVANIYIDNFITPVKVLNMNGPTTWQKTWTSPLLDMGVHTVMVEHVSGTYVDVDAIQVHVPVTSGIFDDRYPTWSYTGNWTQINAGGPYQNTFTYSATAGNSAMFTFEGRKFTLYYLQYTNRGVMNIYIDDFTTPAAVLNMYGSLVWQKTWTSDTLSPGIHKIKLVHVSGTYVDVDAIQIHNPLPPAKYDDRHSGWNYAGSWTQLSSGDAYLSTFTYSAAANNSAMFTFEGKKFTLYYLQYTNRGVANIYIDDFTTPAKVLNMNGPLVWQQAWTSPTLTSDVHTVKVVHVSGTYVDVDAIQIIGTSDTTLPSAINPLTAATGAANGTVNLNWTSVGDDGMLGTATSYLVRYSTSAISDDDAWNAATPVTTGIPTPKAPGNPEIMMVSGLVPGQTYYFAVRAQDEELNSGELSNSPSAVAKSPTPMPPNKYDDRHSAWVYTGSWTQANTTGPYLGTFTYSATVGNSAMFTFEGNRFTLYYLQYTNRGLANIYIDDFDTPAVVLNMNGSQVWQKSWDSGPLGSDVHTVKVVHVSGTYMDVDAIEVFGVLDSIPPSAINPLSAATGSAGGSVNLSWTSVGDDGPLGTATSYLVRYSTSIISNDDAWNAATPVTTGIPTPQAAGNSESMVVSGLVPGQTYYFAIRARDEESNQGALSNSPSAVAKVPGPVTSGLYDDRATGWTYTGTWVQGNTTGPHLGTFMYSTLLGSRASYTFEGRKFTLYYLQYTNRGTARVYIDNIEAPTATINMNGTMVWQKAWTSPTLTAGVHTVIIEHASGTYMDVDAIQIYDPFPLGKWDDPDTRFTYVGNWTPSTTTGPHLDTFTYSSTVNDAAVFAFEGSRFTLSYLQFTNRGTMKIYIDNFDTPVTTLNMNGSMVWQQTWTSPPLTAGVHVVKLVHASGTYVDVDAVLIE